jgi:multiple sugar transport system ATP-binding protein
VARIRFESVGKRYPNGFVALEDLNLDIADREFLVLLGPSGCGKSTTLNMIAGLEEVTQGRLLFDERLMNAVPPHHRDVAMVFQSYALYPHKTVYDNVAFGLKMRKYPRDEIDRRVREAARRLEIENLLERRPEQLSGGQRQRVALAGRIISVLPIGSDQFLELDVEGCKVFVRVAKAWLAQVGSIVHLRVDRQRMHLFDPATQKSLFEQPVEEN